ncbi:MAG: amino acid permease, partial [Elusimicrobiota bacterium]
MDNHHATGLARRLGLGALIFYGIGDILGAGIYALVGKVAAIAGPSAWISFAISGMLALVTGLTYAELSSRVPKSGGAAAFVAGAFDNRALSFMTGFFVLASGITSTAAVSLAIYGYLDVFIDLPPLLTAFGLIALISLVSFWGIKQSANINMV